MGHYKNFPCLTSIQGLIIFRIGSKANIVIPLFSSFFSHFEPHSTACGILATEAPACLKEPDIKSGPVLANLTNNFKLYELRGGPVALPAPLYQTLLVGNHHY